MLGNGLHDLWCRELRDELLRREAAAAIGPTRADACDRGPCAASDGDSGGGEGEHLLGVGDGAVKSEK